MIRPSPKRDAAQKFLLDFLHEPKRADEVKKAASAAGISYSYLARLTSTDLKYLKVKKKDNIWSLPSSTERETPLPATWDERSRKGIKPASRRPRQPQGHVWIAAAELPVTSPRLAYIYSQAARHGEPMGVQVEQAVILDLYCKHCRADYSRLLRAGSVDEPCQRRTPFRLWNPVPEHLRGKLATQDSYLSDSAHARHR